MWTTLVTYDGSLINCYGLKPKVCGYVLLAPCVILWTLINLLVAYDGSLINYYGLKPKMCGYVLLAPWVIP